MKGKKFLCTRNTSNCKYVSFPHQFSGNRIEFYNFILILLRVSIDCTSQRLRPKRLSPVTELRKALLLACYKGYNSWMANGNGARCGRTAYSFHAVLGYTNPSASWYASESLWAPSFWIFMEVPLYGNGLLNHWLLVIKSVSGMGLNVPNL